MIDPKIILENGGSLDGLEIGGLTIGHINVTGDGQVNIYPTGVLEQSVTLGIDASLAGPIITIATIINIIPHQE